MSIELTDEVLSTVVDLYMSRLKIGSEDSLLTAMVSLATRRQVDIDPEYKELLELKYVNDLSWNDVAMYFARIDGKDYLRQRLLDRNSGL